MIKDILHVGYSEFRIETDGNIHKFLFADCDDAGMRELSHSEFMVELLSVAHVCLTSWNKELTEKYTVFYKEAWNIGKT